MLTHLISVHLLGSYWATEQAQRRGATMCFGDPMGWRGSIADLSLFVLIKRFIDQTARWRDEPC